MWRFSHKDVLKNHLNKCFDECNIIIAASRIRKNIVTDKDVNVFLTIKCKEKGFQQIKVTNYRNEPQKDKLNELSAKHIIDLIGKIVKGTM